MTKIKFCGMRRPADIEAANALQPDYIGFVFAKGYRRCVKKEEAAAMKALLQPGIQTVGVFVDNPPEEILDLLSNGIIDIAQLHGSEGDDMIRMIQERSGKPVMKAFRITSEADIRAAEESCADAILLDAGAGEGRVFDWALLDAIERPYFLAGGLNQENVGEAVRLASPFAVDVSTGIETEGVKDAKKMAAFAAAVRKEA